MDKTYTFATEPLSLGHVVEVYTVGVEGSVTGTTKKKISSLLTNLTYLSNIPFLRRTGLILTGIFFRDMGRKLSCDAIVGKCFGNRKFQELL